MALLTPYREVLTLPGAAAFSFAGVVARLPISMTSLGIVLLVESGTGSYGVAGTVAATYTIANAALAIVQGRLIDRFGQRPVLAIGVTTFSVAMTLLVLAQLGHWPTAFTYLFAALGGGTLPQVGSCVRARWSHLLRGKPGLPTAYALEGALDEAVFMLGPIIATLLATQVSSWTGVGAAVVLGLIGTTAFVSLRSTIPPARHRQHGSTSQAPTARLPWATVLPLALVCVGMGVFFGAGEITTVAYTEERGSPGAAGILLGLWAAGSMVAGLVAGTISWRIPSATRVRIGSVLMALSLIPLVVIDHLAIAAVVLLLAGVTVAPTLIAAFSLAESVLPAGRITEGMSVLQTGMVIGVAAGATFSGMVVDSHGAAMAWLVSIVAAGAAALAAQLLPRPQHA